MTRSWLSDVLVMAAMGAATSVFAPALFLALRPVVPKAWLKIPPGVALAFFIIWHGAITILMPSRMGHPEVLLLFLALLAGSLVFWAPMLREERRLSAAGRTFYLFLGCPLLDMAAVYPISLGDAPGGVAMVAGMMPLTVFGAWSLVSMALREERQARARETAGSLRRPPLEEVPAAVVARGQPARRHLAPGRPAEIALGLLWLVDGFMQLQPALFGTSMARHILLPGPKTEGLLFAHLVGPVDHAAVAHWAVVNTLVGIGQLVLGACTLFEATASRALVAGVAWAVVVWVVGEGLGGLAGPAASPFAGAPGPALVYAAASVVLLAYRGGPWPVGSAGGAHFDAAVIARWAWAATWIVTAILFVAPGPLSARLSWGAVSAWERGSLAVAASVAALLVVPWWRPSLSRVRSGVILGVLVALLDGWLGQRFGGVLASGATDPGLAPAMIVLGMAAWPYAARSQVPPAVVVPDQIAVTGAGLHRAQVAGELTHTG